MITLFFRFICITVLLLLLQGCGQQDAQPAAGDALGLVNGAPVSEQAFQQRVQLRQANLPSALGGTDGEVPVALKRRVVWELIDEKLLSEEASRRSVTITDAEAEQALAAFQAGFANQQAFDEYLAAYPGGLTALQNEQRMSLLHSRLAGEPPAVSDADVARYYQQHKDLYQHPAYLLADEIVLLDEAGRNEATELSTLRQRIIDEHLSFRHQARKHSQGATAQQGGDIGRVTSGSARPEIWNAIRTLQSGQISAPIALPDRTLLIQVRDRVAASSKSLSQVSAAIRSELTQSLQRAREAELIAELRASAAAHNRFEDAGQVSGDPETPMILGAGAAAQELGQDLKQGGTALLAGPGS